MGYGCSSLVGTIDSNSSLFRLSYLQRLNLSGNNFFSLQTLILSDYHIGLRLEPHNFKLLLQNLSQLRELDLSRLSGYFPKTKWNSSASLAKLNLDGVNFSGELLPDSLGYATPVQILSLSSCNLTGPIPKSLWNLTRIETLDLGNNHLDGPTFPQFTNGLQNLKRLWLSNNSLNGAIPSWVFSLPSLSELRLRDNNFSSQLEDFRYNSGNVDVSLFSDLKQLSSLDLSYNSISVINENKVNSTLPQSLQHLLLSGCEINEVDFLGSAKGLQELDLSNNKIQGRFPDSAWSNWMHSMAYLDLSHNMFDNLTGEIPLSVCNLTSLIVLDLARNSLKGAIPHCLGNMSDQLKVLDMQHNSLSGNLPTTFSFGSGLKSFNLHHNKLEGKIPKSLANCAQLEVLDLGNNYLNDTFPMWLGTLPNLQVLSLRSNKLHGPIRTSSSSKLFPQLRMVDLSSNAFTAELPTSLCRNLKATRRIDQTMKAPGDTTQTYYQDSVTILTKGLELKVVRILSLYTTMDLSSNKFEGHITSMMGDFTALRVLNLSHNGLQGPIPPSLGKLSVVESLDLSSNKLSGEIPKQLASLTSLAVLNLSRNHLEGCIPKGPQFATFENNSYEGNDGLRGFPVSGACGSHQIPETNNTTFVPDEESDSTFLSELSWKVVLMGFSIAYVMLSSRNPIGFQG
ncbi:hypothetical protein P3S67_017262 [Capsicum chacoense]